MRFWQKTYLLTLLLFLLLLDAGALSLFFFSYDQSVSSTRRACLFEQKYIADSLEHSISMLDDPLPVFQNYGILYGVEGVFTAYEKDGESILSLFPASLPLPEENSSSFEKSAGKKFFVSRIGIGKTGYDFLYCKDVSEIDEDFYNLVVTFLVSLSVISLLLAVLLYFLLRRLSSPLEKLKDTTDKIAAGQNRLRAEIIGRDEIAALAVSINGMLDRIDSQMDELRESAEKKEMLVNNMAHELRTPLTVIKGYAEYLKNAVLSEEERQEATDYILCETDRLKKISEKLLDTAYIGHKEAEKHPVSLILLIASSLAVCGKKADEKGVALVSSGEEVTASGDETLFGLLLVNLLENAVKASSPGSAVTVTCGKEKGRPFFSVKDEGIGMTKEELSKITEPFYKADKARSRAEGGAGLGLSLCRQIALSYEAEMSFVSAVGKGTTVTVSFPA